jgi:hypothetical protein
VVANLWQFHGGLIIRLLYLHQIVHLHSIGGKAGCRRQAVFGLHELNGDFLSGRLYVDDEG